MDTLSFLNDAEYIRAAPDIPLSSSQTHLLSTLLSQEDEHDYNQIINIQLSPDILYILQQLTSLLHLDSSTISMTILLLKKLTIQRDSIDLLTLVASITLSAKYQHSQPQIIDYNLIAQSCHIENIQLIHNAEVDLLDVFSYDICMTTPDHFFSYLSNLTNNDHNLKQIIEQARSSLSNNSFSHQTLGLLHNYPSSIITLSLICNITSDTFIVQQIKSFLLHKKDPTHYFKQLLHCTDQLKSRTS